MSRADRAPRMSRRVLAGAGAAAVLALPGSAVASGNPSGGTGFGPVPTGSTPTHLPPPPSKHAKGRWVSGFTLTEYWPAPEWWFAGRLVHAPGLAGLYPIDWLYSATGISMQGEGLGLDGRLYHIAQIGDGGWVTAAGTPTSAADGWSAGSPYWRAGGYWSSRSGAVTYPLQRGGWSAGRGRRYIPLPNVSFALGASLPLSFYRSIAVDPSVIPLGSRVYIPSYAHDGYGGWFIAKDTGGAINGRHIDIYRSPPASPADSGRYLTSQRVFVVRPKHG